MASSSSMLGITNQSNWYDQLSTMPEEARTSAINDKIQSVTKSLKKAKLNKETIEELATEYAAGNIPEGYRKKTTVKTISLLFLSHLSDEEAQGTIPTGLYLLLKKRIRIKKLDRGGKNTSLSLAFHWESGKLYIIRSCLSGKVGPHEKKLNRLLISKPEYFASGIAVDYQSHKLKYPEHKLNKTCFILEYYPQGSLQKNITKFRNTSETYKINSEQYSKLDFITHLARGILYLHQLGYCHLDLKPGNILIDQSGMPKIIDFGLSRPPEGINRGGTRYYVSPQTLINRHYLDVEFVASFSDDVWSLATILSDFHLNPYNMTSYNPWLDFCHKTGWKLLKKEDVETNISLFYHEATYLNVIMQKGLAYDREDRISMEGILEVLQEEKQRCDAALTTKKKKRYIFF